MAKPLTVVTDETPVPRKPPSTIKAAVELTERDLLVAMRTKVASEIDSGVPAHALAPLMRQLREFDREIRALDARSEQEANRGDEATDEAFDAEAI